MIETNLLIPNEIREIVMAQGPPMRVGQLEKKNGHNLEAEEGRFHRLVWRCLDCGEVRTQVKHYTNFDCK